MIFFFFFFFLHSYEFRKNLNRHDISALVLAIDESKKIQEETENESACSYEDLPLTPNKKEEERLIVASLFSELWSKYFLKEKTLQLQVREQ